MEWINGAHVVARRGLRSFEDCGCVNFPDNDSFYKQGNTQFHVRPSEPHAAGLQIPQASSTSICGTFRLIFSP
jgi:hypothetical protein